MEPGNTGEIQNGRFKPGISGNKAGKPRGALNKTTLAVKNLLDGDAELITRKAVELALSGDTTALKICMERLAPALKPTSAPIIIDLPPPNNLAETAKFFLSATALGQLAPDIAAQLISSVAAVARIEEIESLKQRLETLERASKAKGV